MRSLSIQNIATNRWRTIIKSSDRCERIWFSCHGISFLSVGTKLFVASANYGTRILVSIRRTCWFHFLKQWVGPYSSLSSSSSFSSSLSPSSFLSLSSSSSSSPSSVSGSGSMMRTSLPNASASSGDILKYTWKPRGAHNSSTVNVLRQTVAQSASHFILFDATHEGFSDLFSTLWKGLKQTTNVPYRQTMDGILRKEGPPMKMEGHLWRSECDAIVDYENVVSAKSCVLRCHRTIFCFDPNLRWN